MVKSMTGFGRAQGETRLGKVTVELRSVNHRYCDISLRVPKRLSLLENRLKEAVRTEVSRGKLDVSVKFDSGAEEAGVRLGVDFHLAEQYYDALRSLKEHFGVEGEVTLGLLAAAKDIIVAKEEEGDVESIWPDVQRILREALGEMDRMRRLEGEALGKDLRERLERIAERLKEVKAKFPSSLQGYQKRLRERIEGLMAGLPGSLDPLRFQQEVAFLAERMDITEEVVRAESHLAQFERFLGSEEAVGRKLDFLIQEIHREVNTISSKINDAEISQTVVEVKAELEKIREQVQNLE
jgi:uncharacterized protein (TIGR00255 family)